MVQLSIQAVNNQNLFSNHYLKNLIRNNDEWRSNDHKTVFDEIKKIYDAEKPFLEDLNESQLEERFFKRIFKIMLPDFEVQAGTESQDFPDYAFFEDTNALGAAHRNKGNRSFYQNAFAVGEVKRWDTNLDRFGKGKHDKNMNPSFQIWLYLHETEPEWGVLSNGRLWRLYHQDKLMDSYYEVDLVTILEKEDIDAFKYFYYFFRREAFFPSQKGSIFLENVLGESEKYATDIGEDLKENVYRAMKILAEGFFCHPANGLDRNDEKARSGVQNTTMRLLYRFLFLLYAEGKGLLSGSAYIESPYSFYSIKNKIKGEKDSRNAILEEGSRYWTELQDLFGLIDAGNETLGIPAYNGGLFDSERNPNLLKWRIGDRYLADAIDLLSRSDGRNGGRRLGFVDYSSLDIRHLGSIYEGLLEYRLRVAETDMVATGGKKREWVSLEDFNSSRKRKKNFSDFDLFDRVKEDELYLSTDKGERKATGSYYTPDYIVNYIVKNTIDPVVDERWQKASDRNESLIDATLSVKVLDPAMGSGHFLVGALEHLSARLMEAVRVEAESGRIPDDAKDRYTLEWAKREVAAHCIYGVDLNYLAVELAKVSLWLKTIAMDKPLSFLDHRLKCGNSLIGAELLDLKDFPSSERQDEKTKAGEQSKLPYFVSEWFIKHLIGKIGELEEISDDSLSDIKRKERVFEEFKQLSEYRKAKAIANVHTAIYFGNEVEPTAKKKSDRVYHDLFWAVGGDEKEWRRKTNWTWFREAQRIAEDKSFFHWELEFPEMFFEDGWGKENPGWDVVIGNPPYQVMENMPTQDRTFYYAEYNSGPIFQTAIHKSNIYALFSEQALKLNKTDGYFSFIMPYSWLSNSSFLNLRQLLVEQASLREISLLPVGVFDAGIATCVTIAWNTPSGTTMQARDLRNVVLRELPDYLYNSSVLYSIPLQTFRCTSDWVINLHWNPMKQAILDKMESIIWRLEEICTVDRGADAADNEKFIGYEFKPELNPKRLLIGEAFGRYDYFWDGLYLYYLPEQMKAAKSTARPGTSGRFEIPEKIILYRFLNKVLGFVCIYENEQSYSLGSTYVLAINTDLAISLKYVTALLNSKLTAFYNNDFFAGVKITLTELRRIPIRRINFTTLPEERTALVESLKSKYYANEFDKTIQLVEECLPKDAEGNFVTKKEKSDVVHDLLAFLAERMIEMNKEKNEEIKGFLGWFEREIGAEIEALTNRTKLKQYHDLDFDELLDILKKNKKKIPVNLSNRELQGNLKDEFEGSMKKLKPLIEMIGKTDWLIDQVVYRLYGLSEEEIGVVEESE